MCTNGHHQTITEFHGLCVDQNPAQQLIPASEMFHVFIAVILSGIFVKDHLRQNSTI